MFTGIVESTGVVVKVSKEGGNLKLRLKSPFTQELKIDQSISHNGVCLTVTNISGDEYEVIAIAETISKTNFGELKEGDEVNLERSLKLGDRLDGHMVQGHVDEKATCISVENQNGSWLFTFQLQSNTKNILVEKGSVCINGVSLTVVDATKNNFSVAIIPYTYEHTNFKKIKTGDHVNIEFDVIGKYVQKIMSERV